LLLNFGKLRPAFWLLRFMLACSLLAASSWASAQGYELLPWKSDRPVPAFEGTDLQGRVWRLADLRGKAVLINFWASWCEPCRAELPSLQALAQRLGTDKLLVLTVNFKESATTVQRFSQRNELTLPVLLDGQGMLARQWGVSVFPSTVMINAKGQVQGVLRGELDWLGPAATQWIGPMLASAGHGGRT
jgi:thiol-disulfide isomerase/thioredoxin